MEKISLKKTVFEIEYDGETYKVRRPFVKEVQEFSKTNDVDSFEKLLDLIDACGLPKSVTEEMDTDLIEQVSELILPKKKK